MIPEPTTAIKLTGTAMKTTTTATNIAQTSATTSTSSTTTSDLATTTPTVTTSTTSTPSTTTTSPPTLRPVKPGNQAQLKEMEQCTSRDAATYLQKNVIPHLVVQSKEEYYYNNKNGDEQFNTGFSTLYSQQCPILRSNYLCLNMNENRFENYTLTLDNNYTNYVDNVSIDDNSTCNNKIKNGKFGEFFSSNIEYKIMTRLFETGGLFDNNKNMTIVIWGNSYLRQIFEALGCMLIQFNFTPLEMYRYSSIKNQKQYNKNGYYNKNDYSGDIRFSDLVKPVDQPCFFTKNTMLRDLQLNVNRYNISHNITLLDWIIKYTNWTQLYTKYYVTKLRQKHGDSNYNINYNREEQEEQEEQEHLDQIFFNLTQSDLNQLESIGSDALKIENKNSSRIKKQIANNIIDFYHECDDGYLGYIGFFNNKTQTRNNIFYLSSNIDHDYHSIVNRLKLFEKEYMNNFDKFGIQYDNLSHFINDIDTMIINFGNRYENVERYNLSQLEKEYIEIKNIGQNKSIPMIITSAWTWQYYNKSEWKQFETNFIDKYQLPIVHYSLLDVVTKSTITEKEENSLLTQSKTHYCMPGTSIKFAFTFIEMVEMMTSFG